MNEESTAELAARVRRSITRLHRRLRQSSLGGLSPAQASMLSSVEALGSPTLGDLAVREQVQPPSVTRIVQSLSAAGLIETIIDPADRRCTRASLTPRGRHELTAIRQRKNAYLSEHLRKLPEADLRRAAQLADLLESLLEDA